MNQGRSADTVQNSGAFLLAATHHVSTLRALTERLRRARDATENVLSLGASPEAWGRHRRAARALAEAELALRVAEGSV
jgi:Type III secretion system, cytoplasmic E component of needle